MSTLPTSLRLYPPGAEYKQVNQGWLRKTSGKNTKVSVDVVRSFLSEPRTSADHVCAHIYGLLSVR
jgi:hypothetical protein